MLCPHPVSRLHEWRFWKKADELSKLWSQILLKGVGSVVFPIRHAARSLLAFPDRAFSPSANLFVLGLALAAWLACAHGVAEESSGVNPAGAVPSESSFEHSRLLPPSTGDSVATFISAIARRMDSGDLMVAFYRPNANDITHERPVVCLNWDVDGKNYVHIEIEISADLAALLAYAAPQVYAVLAETLPAAFGPASTGASRTGRLSTVLPVEIALRIDARLDSRNIARLSNNALPFESIVLPDRWWRLSLAGIANVEREARDGSPFALHIVPEISFEEVPVEFVVAQGSRRFALYLGNLHGVVISVRPAPSLTFFENDSVKIGGANPRPISDPFVKKMFISGFENALGAKIDTVSSEEFRHRKLAIDAKEDTSAALHRTPRFSQNRETQDGEYALITLGKNTWPVVSRALECWKDGTPISGHLIPTENVGNGAKNEVPLTIGLRLRKDGLCPSFGFEFKDISVPKRTWRIRFSDSNDDSAQPVSVSDAPLLAIDQPAIGPYASPAPPNRIALFARGPIGFSMNQNGLSLRATDSNLCPYLNIVYPRTSFVTFDIDKANIAWMANKTVSLGGDFVVTPEFFTCLGIVGTTTLDEKSMLFRTSGYKAAYCWDKKRLELELKGMQGANLAFMLPPSNPFADIRFSNVTIDNWDMTYAYDGIRGITSIDIPSLSIQGDASCQNVPLVMETNPIFAALRYRGSTQGAFRAEIEDNLVEEMWAWWRYYPISSESSTDKAAGQIPGDRGLWDFVGLASKILNRSSPYVWLPQLAALADASAKGKAELMEPEPIRAGVEAHVRRDRACVVLSVYPPGWARSSNKCFLARSGDIYIRPVNMSNFLLKGTSEAALLDRVGTDLWFDATIDILSQKVAYRPSRTLDWLGTGNKKLTVVPANSKSRGKNARRSPSSGEKP